MIDREIKDRRRYHFLLFSEIFKINTRNGGSGPTDRSPQTGEENTVLIGVDRCVSNETERDRTRPNGIDMKFYL